MALGDPAQREERGMDAEFGEEIDEPVGIGGNPRRHRIPDVARHRLLQRLDLEIILDIDAHGIDQRGVDRGYLGPQRDRFA